MKSILEALRNRLRIALARAGGARIGENCLLGKGLEFGHPAGMVLGNHSALYKCVTIYAHEPGRFVMGHHSHVAPYGYFLVHAQTVSIGNDVAIGPFCSFFCSSNTHSREEPLFRKNYNQGDITIGNNVFIGAHCVIQPGTVIEDHVLLAANSVARGRLESGFIYGGSPAVKLKPLA